MAANSVTVPSQNGIPEIHETASALSTFRNFDFVPAFPADHHYKTSGGSSLTREAQKIIMREWKQLEKDLPNTIYVRAYENRINLLRAVIVGALATPYHDGLYFFDILIPDNYPTRPPQVYYWCFGLRINPNLYANGRVCLSLLNTWRGSKTEKWNLDSTILQVLVSIQGLVLNEKPFYNEPGTGSGNKRNVFEKISVTYSENAFILSRKTMIHLAKKPPAHFEEFVGSYFRERAVVILSACEAYMNGKVTVGYYNSNTTPFKGQAVVSSKFKANMRALFPLLLTAFEQTGVSVGRFAAYKVALAPVKKAKTKKKKSIVMKLFQKLTMLFGFEKKRVETTGPKPN